MPNNDRSFDGVWALSRLPLPLLILPAVALLAASRLPRWGFMWAMAFALYAGCKWLTYHAINIVFAYLPIVYALAASRPHWLLR